MINENDLIWHEHFTNNIKTNPKDCDFCIILTNENEGRIYKIMEQYPLHENGMICPTKDKPELYILFEGIIKKIMR